MRRLARHLFTLCSAVSLLICVLTAWAWVRSYSYEFGMTYMTEPSPPPHCRRYQLEFGSGYGRLGLQFTTQTWDVYDAYGAREDADQRSYARLSWGGAEGAALEEYSPIGGRQPHTLLGFAVESRTREAWVGNGVAWHDRRLHLPYWFAVAVTLAPPLFTARRSHTRRRRAANGLCPACGYDLRASPERCRECGSPTAAG
jgi:hypothetical protein